MKNVIYDMLPQRIYLELKRWDYKRSKSVGFEYSQWMRKATSKKGYSYKPFDEKKAIFIHIPKCAGVSVNKKLFGNLAGGHTTFNEYSVIFEPRLLTEYFKFTIVRNPWDRLVSAYFFLKNGGFDEEDRNWSEKELKYISSFEDFVKIWLSRSNIWKWPHFRPQYHYMLEKREKVYIDFVAFFENIHEDFSYITSRLEMQCSLPVSNKGNHGLYKNYYDSEMIKIVGNVYSEDIRMLGYKFDNSDLDQQLAERSSGHIYTLHT
ncbi:sulfotransferase family 2 domain-containing protein [Halochromatium glycolicum]|uniref:sulfotransferase family 2 domain-containing protein n=1 Tax=Halochromatium glycolicum TaxID=85075 RepID=UPI00190D2D92